MKGHFPNDINEFLTCFPRLPDFG